MGLDQLKFYHPWPLFGKGLGFQLTEIREDMDNLATLMRAATADISQTSGQHDLAGWAIGELDFRNRFQTFYDKVNDEFKIRFNSGTEAAPTWIDCLRIRQSDCRVIAAGVGGFESLGGFYNLEVPNDNARSKVFSSSFEWEFQHNLGTKPILWNAFNDLDESLVPSKVDVSNLNIAYFYFDALEAGTAIVSANNTKLQTIGSFYFAATNTDEDSPVFRSNERVLMRFESDDFYVIDEGGESLRIKLDRSNLGGGGSSGVTFTDGVNVHTNKTTLNVSGNDFYLSTDLSGDPVLNLGPRIEVIEGKADDALASTFYGSTIKQVASDGTDTAVFREIGVISFEGENFYVVQNAPNTDEVLVNFKGGGSVTDHGLLDGLSDDDHTQYTLASGSRAFTGDQSMGSNKLTSLGAPTADSDAARLQDVGPGFYGIGVKHSDDTASFQGIKVITVNSDDFYLTQNDPNTDEVVINLRAAAGGTTSATSDFSSAVEWTFNHSLGSSPVLWDTFDDGDQAIIPDTVDVSDPDTAYFYFLNAVAGSAIVSTGGTGTSASSSSSGAVVLISSTPVSGGTEYVQIDNLDATYDLYKIVVMDAVPADDGKTLVLEVSTDGGSTWKTGASDYSWVNLGLTQNSGLGKNEAATDTQMQLSGTTVTGTGTGEGIGILNIEIIRPSTVASGMFREIKWDGSLFSSTTSTTRMLGSGTFENGGTAATYNSVRLAWASQGGTHAAETWTTGLVKVYGIT